MDTKYLRSYISSILIESINENDYRGDFSRNVSYGDKSDSFYNKNFTCSESGHSNGFIDSFGDYIDLTKTRYNTHDEWLEFTYGDVEHEEYGMEFTYDWDEIPENLIMVSNPTMFSIKHDDWNIVTDKQIHGMIDCMLSCKDKSPWIKNNIEKQEILFFHTGFAASMNYMTFPEFLELYGNRSHMDRLFNELMS